MGDTVVAIPAINKIARRHPKQQIYLITSKNKSQNSATAWEVLKHAKIFNDVIYYNNFWDVILLAKKIRTNRGRGDGLYYLPAMRSRLQSIRDYLFFRYACGLRIMPGFNKAIGKIAERDSHGKIKNAEKEYIRLQKIIDSENTESKIDPKLLLDPENDTSGFDKFIKKDDFLIGIGHGSNKSVGLWPKERYRELCKKLLKLIPEAKIILLGGKNDYPAGEYMKDREERIINLSGHTSIAQSAALLKKCKIFIGNDSGAMHLAAAMEIPVVAIFSGRDNPGKWDPLGDNHIILRKSVPCEGCFLRDCKKNDNLCLKLISADEVFQAAINLINAK